MGHHVVSQMWLAQKALVASFSGADKGSVVDVGAFMPAQGAWLCKGFCAAFTDTDKGLFSRMDVDVSLEVNTLPKCAGAVGPGADKGFFSGMAAQMVVQAIALGKGFAAGFIGTDKGALAGMGAQVLEHFRPAAAPRLAAFIGTDKGAPATPAPTAVPRPAAGACRWCQVGCVCGGRHGARSRYEAASHKVLHGIGCAWISGRSPVGQPLPGPSHFLANRNVSG